MIIVGAFIVVLALVLNLIVCMTIALLINKLILNTLGVDALGNNLKNKLNK